MTSLLCIQYIYKHIHQSQNPIQDTVQYISVVTVEKTHKGSY